MNIEAINKTLVDEIQISSKKEFFLKILIKQSKSTNKVVDYTIHKGILYKKSFLKLLLCCIPLDMVLCPRKNSWGSMLWTSEVRTLTYCIIHQGHYWPTLRQDALNFVQKYKCCNSFGDVIWLPSIQQTLVTSTWLFDMREMDLMEKISKSESRVEYVVVTIDYFSKCINVKPVNLTEENVLNYFHDSILCRFGVPRAMVMDHGTQFSKKFTNECNCLYIKHWKSSVVHPQGNGQAKVANKLVIQALKKNLESQ